MAVVIRLQSKGFTLIEVLVVVFIIAIMTGISVLSLSNAGAQRRLAEEAKQLQLLMSLAAQEAVIFGSPIGVVVTSQGYHFVIAGADHWQKLLQQSQLIAQTVPDMMHIEVVETAPLFPDSRVSTEFQPQVIFFPTGLVSDFTINLSVVEQGETITYQLLLLETGDIGMVNPDEL